MLLLLVVLLLGATLVCRAIMLLQPIHPIQHDLQCLNCGPAVLHCQHVMKLKLSRQRAKYTF